ncbi:MAG: membrane protein [Cyclobacteriaceae bacterium]|nr:MAG: membrane protein [Cyclobacteriaceae bacterium]
MNFKKDLLPHIISIVVFIGVTVVFYSPVVFSGKTLNQHDIIQGLGASQEIIEYREATGQEALWTNSMFGGMPAYLINMNWSGDLMLYLHRILSLWLPGPAGATLLAFISFYILLLSFKVRPYLALIGGLAYGLSSFNVISIEAGHMWKVWAIAYMPMVLAGVHLTVRRKYLLGMTVTALGLALELRSNHLQITYYLLLLLLIYGLIQLIFAIRDDELPSLMKSVGYLVVAALLAIGCNLGKIWSVYEYGQYSTRGPSDLTNTQSDGSGLDKDYIFRWSNGIMEPITLLIPEFFGGPTVSSLSANSNLGEALRNNGLAPVQVRQQLQQVYTYWGKQPSTAGPSYAGAVIIFLFILGYTLLDKKFLIWISVAIAFSILLSWGNNFESFNNLMFEYFPGYNKFRSVSMTLVIALVCIPLAALVCLEKILQDIGNPQLRKKVLKASAITGGILLLAILYSYLGSFRGSVDQQLAGQLPDWYLEAMQKDRASLLRSDAFRSLIFIGLTLALLHVRANNKINHSMLIIGLAVLVLIDLWSVDKRYLQSEDFVPKSKQALVSPTEANRTIQNDPEPGYRVLSFLQNPWSDARTSYFHNSIGGYHGAKMRRYQELIEGCLDDQFRGIIQDIQNGQREWDQYGIINMLNTRYFIAGAESNSVLKNNGALGNAWLVSSVTSVNSADEELELVCQINPKSTAVVDVSRFPVSGNSFNDAGEIVLEEQRPNYLKYRYENSGSGFAVFSEIYYPEGWTASIDGEPAAIIRANYVLRALEVPDGEHIIEFQFEPSAYYTGNKIMMASSLLLLLVIAGTVWYEFKRVMSSNRPAA